MEAPTLDLDDLLSDDLARRASAAQTLRSGMAELGLVYVRGHGLDQTEVLDLYDQFVEVLRRPVEEKAGWGGPSLWYQRGWTPPDTERAVAAHGQPDFKECFFAAPLAGDPRCRAWYPEIFADNVWPEGADAFRSGLLGVGRAVHQVGLVLLRGVAESLDLDPTTLTDRVEGAASVTRLLRYLPLQPQHLAGPEILWGEEHTDFNLLTLLPGGCFYQGDRRSHGRPDGGGAGLRLRTRPTAEHPFGRLVPGAPPPGCWVAQVGQQLEILTGGLLQATPHGITAPREVGWSRVSLAHFLHVHPLTVLSPLPELAYLAADVGPPVLAGTYALKTLVDIGLAPRTVLDRLGYRHYDRLEALRQGEATQARR